MATTTQGAALTEAHRAEQATRAAFVAAAGLRLWNRTIKPDQLERTVAVWMRLMLALIQREHERSYKLTKAYYPEFRRIELPGGPAFKFPAEQKLNKEQVFTSLRVTGPIALQKKLTEIERLDLTEPLERALVDEAMESAARTSSAAAVRHTLSGGRDLMREVARTDKAALGWARVTQDNPCYFCAMLASRGFVYGEDAFEDSDALFTGGGRAKVHDGCQCTMEPTFKRGSAMPGRGEEFSELWAEVTAEHGVGGREAIRAFRAAIEGREFKPRRRR
jgi:hypothetical protein